MTQLEMTIIIDTREQQPLTFSLPTERGTLPTGDYSVLGFEDRIAIERKQVDDLVQCLKNPHRKRFERELTRGQAMDYFALVIEANLNHLEDHQYQSAMTPAAVIQSLMTFSVRYRLPVFFCPDRRYVAKVIESLLEKYVREVEKQSKYPETCTGRKRNNHTFQGTLLPSRGDRAPIAALCVPRAL